MTRQALSPVGRVEADERGTARAASLVCLAISTRGVRLAWVFAHASFTLRVHDAERVRRVPGPEPWVALAASARIVETRHAPAASQ